MRLRKGSMTAQQREFAKVFAGVANATTAAAVTGYSSPSKYGAQNLENPTILAEIRRIQLARLTNEALPLALNHIVRTLSDENAPIRDKTMVAKIVLDKVTGENQASDKELHELTGAELQATIAKLHDVLKERQAVTIEHQLEPEKVPGLFD